jgi:hypothetical protein
MERAGDPRRREAVRTVVGRVLLLDCPFHEVLARLVSRSGRLYRSRLGGADVDHHLDQRSYVILNTGS